jgi:hypothetical protein
MGGAARAFFQNCRLEEGQDFAFQERSPLPGKPGSDSPAPSWFQHCNHGHVEEIPHEHIGLPEASKVWRINTLTFSRSLLSGVEKQLLAGLYVLKVLRFFVETRKRFRFPHNGRILVASGSAIAV